MSRDISGPASTNGPIQAAMAERRSGSPRTRMCRPTMIQLSTIAARANHITTVTMPAAWPKVKELRPMTCMMPPRERTAPTLWEVIVKTMLPISPIQTARL